MSGRRSRRPRSPCQGSFGGRCERTAEPQGPFTESSADEFLRPVDNVEPSLNDSERTSTLAQPLYQVRNLVDELGRLVDKHGHDEISDS